MAKDETKGAAKKAKPKKTSAKKSAAKATKKKSSPKKTASRKSAAKKSGAKKAAPKKAATKKKATGKKAMTKKAAPKKAASKKSAAKKTAPKKTAAKKTAAKKNASGAAKARPPRGLTLEAIEAGASDNLVMRARSHQFELEPRGAHEPQVFPPPYRELPERYDETRVVLMARDPEWAFLYWEVTDGDLSGAGANPDELVVRLYDITDLDFDGDNAHAVYDTSVGGAPSWYLRLPSPERHWVADLGVVAPDGTFRTIARSNAMVPPPVNVSPLGPREEEWMTVEEDFERIFELSGGRVSRSMDGSEEAMRRVRGRIEFELPRIEMGSEALASGALMGAEFAAPRKGFRLVVNAELIVYGATEPDATVTIQGHPVRLSPDGTFRLRLALPDGVQEIPVRAVRADGEETREAKIVVTRETNK